MTHLKRTEVLARLQHVAAQVFGCDPAAIQDPTTAKDIDRWDSLRHLVFIGNLEREFGCALDLAKVLEVENVGELVDAIVDASGPA